MALVLLPYMYLRCDFIPNVLGRNANPCQLPITEFYIYDLNPQNNRLLLIMIILPNIVDEGRIMLYATFSIVVGY